MGRTTCTAWDIFIRKVADAELSGQMSLTVVMLLPHLSEHTEKVCFYRRCCCCCCSLDEAYC